MKKSRPKSLPNCGAQNFNHMKHPPKKGINFHKELLVIKALLIAKTPM